MYRNFVITVNYTDEMMKMSEEWQLKWAALEDGEEFWQARFTNRIRYLVYQLERGEETGRLHLQMYLELHDSMRIQTVVNVVKSIVGKGKSVRVEKRQGSQTQAVAYCSKEDTRIAGPWSFGKPASRGRSKRDTRKHKSVLLDCISNGLKPREVWVAYPQVYMTHYRFIEHLQRAGLWGVVPTSDEEE